jgi:hypothetical protein
LLYSYEILGVAYVYGGSNTAWSYQLKILAQDGLSGDLLGYSISSYSNILLIGARQDDDKALDAGNNQYNSWITGSRKYIFVYGRFNLLDFSNEVNSV